MAIVDDIPSLLKKAREAAGITMQDAAKRLGVSRKSLGDWESGESRLSAESFVNLLAVYGIETLDDLCQFVAGDEKLNRRAEAIRDLRPGRTAAEYREMADLLERLERLESIVAREKR